MKNRIGMINGIINGSISKEKAESLMKDFPWLSAAVESHRKLNVSSPPSIAAETADTPYDGIDEEINIIEKPKRRGR